MNKKYRILYIQKPPGGGSVVALYDLVNALDKNRFEPVILCYQLNQHTSVLNDLGVKVIFLSTQTIYPAKAIRQKPPLKIFAPLRKFKRLIIDDRRKSKQIRAIIKEQHIDLIHHNNDINDSRQGVLANRKTRLPQVCHYRSLKPYNNDRINGRIDYFMAKNINVHIYISRAVEEHFNRSLKISKKKGVVIRDIVDVQKFKPRPKNCTLLQEFNFSCDDIVLCNIGRLSRWKGQHIFIQALAQVCLRNAQVKALIVGPYDTGIGEPLYYEELKQMISDLHLDNNIFITGNRHDVPEILSIADIVVHSAVEPEPQGLVIVEALMFGKPVIVADAGGAAELIINNQGGLKTKPGNVLALTQAIEQLINNKPQPNQMSLAPGRPAILNEFVPAKQIRAIENIYDSLLQ